MKINKRKRCLKEIIFKLLRLEKRKKRNPIKKKQRLFDFGDSEFFKKKISRTSPSLTPWFLEHHGSKAVDIFAAATAMPILIQIIPRLFNSKEKSEPQLSSNLISDGWDYK